MKKTLVLFLLLVFVFSAALVYAEFSNLNDAGEYLFEEDEEETDSGALVQETITATLCRNIYMEALSFLVKGGFVIADVFKSLFSGQEPNSDPNAIPFIISMWHPSSDQYKQELSQANDPTSRASTLMDVMYGQLPGYRYVKYMKNQALDQFVQNSGCIRIPVDSQTYAYLPNLFEHPDFYIHYTKKYENVWDDAGTGAVVDLTIYKPICPNGFYPLTHVAVPSHDTPENFLGPCIRPKNSKIYNPSGFTELWNDRGSGAKRDVSIWKPNCYDGYAHTGNYASPGYFPPQSTDAVCVHKSLLLPCTTTNQMWTDRCTAAQQDADIWFAEDANCKGVASFAFSTNERTFNKLVAPSNFYDVGNSAFDCFSYLYRYQDVRKYAGANCEKALNHYLVFGINERRDASYTEESIRLAGIDVVGYLLSHADLIQAFGTNVYAALDHWIMYGYDGGLEATKKLTPQRLKYIGLPLPPSNQILFKVAYYITGSGPVVVNPAAPQGPSVDVIESASPASSWSFQTVGTPATTANTPCTNWEKFASNYAYAWVWIPRFYSTSAGSSLSITFEADDVGYLFVNDQQVSLIVNQQTEIDLKALGSTINYGYWNKFYAVAADVCGSGKVGFSFKHNSGFSFPVAYDHCDFAGDGIELKKSSPSLPDGWHDRIASLKLPGIANWKIELFEHPNYQGRMYTIASSDRCFRDGFADVASSYKVYFRDYENMFQEITDDL